jgi:cation:H+ antiporter
VQLSRHEAADPAEDPEPAAIVAGAADRHRPLRQVPRMVVTIVVVVIGAELLVNGAVASARSLGVSDAIIGLTIVAIGTSAPELDPGSPAGGRAVRRELRRVPGMAPPDP